MGRHKDTTTDIQRSITKTIRDEYLLHCNFHDRFVSECNRCFEKNERAMDKEAKS